MKFLLTWQPIHGENRPEGVHEMVCELDLPYLPPEGMEMEFDGMSKKHKVINYGVLIVTGHAYDAKIGLTKLMLHHDAQESNHAALEEKDVIAILLEDYNWKWVREDEIYRYSMG